MSAPSPQIRRCLFLLLGFLLSACATTSPKQADVSKAVNVRPVPLVEPDHLQLAEDYQFALQSYETGKYGLAYSAYKKLLMQSPTETKFLLGFADVALAMANQGAAYQSEAKLVFTQLVTTPDVADEVLAKANTGLILLSNIQSDVKMDGLLQLSENNTDPRVWNALGQTYDKTGEWILALDAYVKALNFSHKNGGTTATVQNNMGMSLLLQGRTDEAVEKFKQAYTASPHIKLYDSNYRLGLIFADNLEQALESVEDSQAAQLLNDAGFIAAGMGETVRARELYQKAIRISPIYFQIAEQNLQALG